MKEINLVDRFLFIVLLGCGGLWGYATFMWLTS